MATMRYSRMQPGADVDAWKEGMTQLMAPRRKELVRRLQQECFAGRNINNIVGDALGVFGSLNNPALERSDLNQRLGNKMCVPTRRHLGTRTLQTKDAEGLTCGEAKTSERYCMDVPIDKTLSTLLQQDERARRQFKAASQRWDDKKVDKNTPQTIYFDIPDGKAFKNHPMLGDDSPWRAGQKGAIMLYYDGFEVS